MKFGNYSGLAESYSLYRPDYSSSVLDSLIELVEKDRSNIDFLDVGAGTGIWTRMVSKRGLKSTTAVEPNEDMRTRGIQDSQDHVIEWINGTAEKLCLPARSRDWVTMASSLHWTDLKLSLPEFKRVLRPSGRFTALWNPRHLEQNPILLEIESYIEKLLPDIKRVSSGSSGLADTIAEKLVESECFDDVVYLEDVHTIKMPQHRYIGVWKSVNDVRVQLGAKKFALFIDFVEQTIKDSEYVEAKYLTRAWSARRTD